LTAGRTGNKAEIEEGRASGREEPAEGKQREEESGKGRRMDFRSR